MLFRVLLLLGLWAALTGPAHAEPSVAVAPIGGDPDDKVSDVVVDVVSAQAKAIKPKTVVRAIGQLGISGDLDARDANRLMKKLEADVVLQGKVKKDGKQRVLRMTVYAKGKKPGSFSVEFKTAKSGKLRDGVRDELAATLAKLDDDDDEKARKKREREEREAKEEEDRRKKQRAEEEEADRRKKKRLAEEDDERRKKAKKKVAVDDDDGERKVKKKKRRRDDDEDGGGDDDDRDPATARLVAQRAGRTMVRLDAGTSMGVRRLTYTAANSPPRVGTFAAAARVEAELYPLASNPRSPAAGLGLAAEYDKTLGLSIQVPGGPSVPIDQSHYSLGARYRLGLGTKTLTLGVDFAKRRYVADRSGLATPNDLDAPDTDYTAVAPGVALRIPVGAKAAWFGNLAALLVLDTGPIQEKDSYGAATVLGGELATGVDVTLSKTLALRFAGELTNISFKFKGNGAQAMARGVTGATDRQFGLAATLGARF